MHMLIRVLVPATDATEAVGVARLALDRLIGISEGASTAFDYYKTLDESTARYRDHPRYGGLDSAYRLSSETGEQLLDDAIEAQTTWFVETVGTLHEKLNRLDPAEVMDDVDLARYDCYRTVRWAVSLDLRRARCRAPFPECGRPLRRGPRHRFALGGAR
ncbi:hypothetical protein [Salinigranum marinum]|uniref:hypothetical protein n=1 Tax=Salinigranum marinum TaxID=1515595 RepID=UPI002989B202|nr:hypothetical protein [Salinigranum marinum]